MIYWKYFAWSLVLYSLLIIQVSFLPNLSIAGVVPDLVFLVIFFWALLVPGEKRFIYVLALLAGLLLENYSGLPIFGLWIITLFLAVLLVRKLGSIVQGLNFFSLFVIFSAVFLWFKFFPFILTFLFTLLQKRILSLPRTFSWQGLAINWGLDLIIVIFYFCVYEFFYKKKS